MGKVKGNWLEYYGMKSGRFTSADFSDIERYVIHDSINMVHSMMPKQASSIFRGEKIKRLGINEQIERDLKETRERLASLEEAQSIIKDFQAKFKRGDIVFSKESGPAIIKDVTIHRDYGMDRPMDINGNPMDIKNNELIAIVSSVEGEMAVPARDIVPYTESVKLLYEAERSQTDES